MTEADKGSAVAAAPPAPTPAYCGVVRCVGGEVYQSLGGDRLCVGDWTDEERLGPWLTGPVKRERKPVNGRGKGLKAERDLSNWLRAQGWPDARRSVATGWKTKDREHQDQGDITGTPGLCAQVKNYADEEPGPSTVDKWARETAEQAGWDRMPLLVVKRNGHANPGMWHLWIRASDLAYLLTGMPSEIIGSRTWVRTTLGQWISCLLDYSRTREQEGAS